MRVQASFCLLSLSSEAVTRASKAGTMLGVANAQLGTAILGLGAAQGMLMSSALNTSASWGSFLGLCIRFTAATLEPQGIQQTTDLPRRFCRAQLEHRKRTPAQTSSLPIAISRAVSPSIEASAAAVSGSAGSPPRCAPLSATARTSARANDSLPRRCQNIASALVLSAEGVLALLSLHNCVAHVQSLPCSHGGHSS